ncbi:hypothetical protein A1OQ_02885 [Enterovibrio norvegicus FF-162]|uniref:hypothetical protein n=1 Tax=Enterovibrio norvegicus TaxID=188144 RepID=UPI0002FF322C|nr:hypothetical protein [Enterovibrio norvegicus]OEE86165.1 hypothetical protein A1OQ_02885 [Enterovibrio norvegicus FF-162]
MNYIKLLIFLYSLLPLSYSMLYFLKGRTNTAVIFYPVFFLFYPLHLLFDVVFGVPYYPKKFSQLEIAVGNHEVISVYLIYIFFLITLIWCLQLKVKVRVSDILPNSKGELKLNISRALMLLLTISSFYFISSPNPEDYLIYGKVREVVRGMLFLDPIAMHYGQVAFFSMISAFFILVVRVMLGKECNNKVRKWLIFLLLVNIYVNNKRLVMAFLPLFYLVEIFIFDGKKGSIRNFILSLVIFAACYYLYAVYLKIDSSKLDEDLIYFYLRHELGRDDIMMYVIQKKIFLNGYIMEYPGQSFIASLLNYFPRGLYADKPYPYSQYLTNVMISGNVGAALMGWTVTTSVFDEFISNFGSIGLLLGPIFLISYCRFTDNISTPTFKLLFVFVLMLLIIVHTSPYATLLYACIGYFIMNYSQRFLISAGFSKGKYRI